MRIIALFFILIPSLAWADIGTFTDRELDHRQLAQELAAVGFICSIGQTDRVIENDMVVLETKMGERLAREVRAGRKVLLDAEGNIIHPSNARPRKTARYIRLDCNEVIDRTAVQGILDAHDVTPMWRRKLRTAATTEAVERLKAASTVLVRNDAMAAKLQTALDRFITEIDAMTLTDLKALDVSAWAGWPQ